MGIWFVPTVEWRLTELKKQMFHYLQSKTKKTERNKNIIKKVIKGKDMEQYSLTADKNYKHFRI